MTKFSDDELLDALGVDQEIEKQNSYNLTEERIISSFKEIQHFIESNGHAPQYSEENDIFEKLYAVRLERFNLQENYRNLLEPLDYQGLLNYEEINSFTAMNDEELLTELEDKGCAYSITELNHVRSQSEIHSSEEIAKRNKCKDFELFKPLFEQVEREFRSGIRQVRRFIRDASINVGNFFILGGQLVYVAKMGKEFKAPNGQPDARLKVVYSNGTESNILLRSLQRALYKDEAGRRLTDPDFGPLFSKEWNDDDIESGTIYVLRSLSNHPFVKENRQLIHKIGVTGGKVETRIANASNSSTYLLADVEIVASYKLFGMNRVKVEKILHRIFSTAQIDITIQDRFGNPISPKEWFFVPLKVIDQAIHHIKEGTITEVVYDSKTASLINISRKEIE